MKCIYEWKERAGLHEYFLEPKILLNPVCPANTSDLEPDSAVKDREGSSSSAGMRAGELLRNINAPRLRGQLQLLDVRLEKKTLPWSQLRHLTALQTAAQTFGAFL